MNRMRTTRIVLISLAVATGIVLWYMLLHELVTGIDPVGKFSGHSDFLAFYTAAKITLAGQVPHLYDIGYFSQLQYALSHLRVGASGYMPFMNPPFIAVVLAPLGWFNEPLARTGWFIANVILAGALCLHLTNTLSLSRNQRLLVTGLLMSTFPMYENLVEGQLSIVMLGGCYLALRYAGRNRLVLSGAWLSVLWIKPQLALMAAAILALFRCWNILGGLLAGGLGLAVLALPATGLSVYGSYWHYLTSVLGDHLNGAGAIYSGAWKGRLALTAGINGLFTAIFGQSAIRLIDGFTALFDIILIAFYLAAARKVSWKPDKSMRPIFAAISVGLIMLLDPHLYQQDVVFAYLLLPLLASKLKQPFMAVLAVVLATDLLALDYLVPLHLFTLALLGLTVGLCWAVITGRPSLLSAPTGYSQPGP